MAIRGPYRPDLLWQWGGGSPTCFLLSDEKGKWNSIHGDLKNLPPSPFFFLRGPGEVEMAKSLPTFSQSTDLLFWGPGRGWGPFLLFSAGRMPFSKLTQGPAGPGTGTASPYSSPPDRAAGLSEPSELWVPHISSICPYRPLGESETFVVVM